MIVKYLVTQAPEPPPPPPHAANRGYYSFRISVPLQNPNVRAKMSCHNFDDVATTLFSKSDKAHKWHKGPLQQ